MIDERPRLHVLIDVDNTLFEAPPSAIAVMQLLICGLRRKPLPEAKPFSQRDTKASPLIAYCSTLLHAFRKPKPDAQASLSQLRQAAVEQDINLELSVLTGREPYLHALTINQLLLSNLSENFAHLYLNPGGSSVGWKKHILSTRPKQETPVQWDDDPRVAFATSAYVYLIENLATNQRLWEFAGVYLPGNAHLSPSLTAAAGHVSQNMRRFVQRRETTLLG